MNRIAIEVPDGARQVIETLQGAGYEAYVVGGCVRDMLLGLAPHDYDITTNATPEQIMQARIVFTMDKKNLALTIKIELPTP